MPVSKHAKSASAENARSGSASGRDALLVLGMHRSGTSATTRVLNLLGADLGNNLMGPGYSNEQGFWEHMDAYRINDRLLTELGMSWNDPRPMPAGWQDSVPFMRALREIVQVLKRDFGASPLWAVKDPRICRLVALWRRALDSLKVVPRCVLVLRHPDEIAGSLGVRDGLSRGQVHLLWARHLCEAERSTRGMARAVIRYDRLLKDWRAEMAQASVAIQLRWPVPYDQAAPEVDGFLNLDSRHHVAEPAQVNDGDGGSVRAWIDEAFATFGAVADSQDWSAASQLVDDFERVTRVADEYLQEVRSGHDALAIERAQYLGVSELVGNVNAVVSSAIAASQAQTDSQMRAALEASRDAIAQVIRDVVTSMQDEAAQRTERDMAAIAHMIQEAEQAKVQSARLMERIAALTQLTSERGTALEAMQAEVDRLRAQLNGSRLETERQQIAFQRMQDTLGARLEGVAACAYLQAELLWEKDREIVAHASELEHTKQSLEAAIRLADSLDARLKHATRPWYQRLVPDKNPNLRKDDR